MTHVDVALKHIMPFSEELNKELERLALEARKKFDLVVIETDFDLLEICERNKPERIVCELGKIINSDSYNPAVYMKKDGKRVSYYTGVMQIGIGIAKILEGESDENTVSIAHMDYFGRLWERKGNLWTHIAPFTPENSTYHTSRNGASEQFRQFLARCTAQQL